VTADTLKTSAYLFFPASGDLENEEDYDRKA